MNYKQKKLAINYVYVFVLISEKCQLLQQDLQSASFDFERSYD